jgi:integrase
MTKKLTAALVERSISDAAKGSRGQDIYDSHTTGLMLRVRGKPSFSFKCRHHGKERRFHLGTAVAGDEDNGAGICLDTARTWSMRIKLLCHPKAKPSDPLKHIVAWRLGTTLERMEAALPPPVPVEKPSITWEEAKASYLAEVERANAYTSHRDYKIKLNVPELQRFNGKPVSQITIEQMSTAIADIHARGKESMAEGTARVVSAMWTFLGNAVNRSRTHVPKNEMLGLKAPNRSRKAGNDEDFDPNDEDSDGKLPTEIDCGRALVIARSGVFPPRPSLMIQLLLGTVQRRRAVTSAHSKRFISYADLHEEAWYVPPWSRKSGADQKSHLVPCVGWVADVVLELDKLMPADEGYLFPPAQIREGAKRPQRHVGINTANKYLSCLPETDIAPHDPRYAFATYGRRDLGFQVQESTGKREAGLILDHSEAKSGDDVTAQFYDRDPSIARKREMMWAWVHWLDNWAAKAIEADPRLLDREYLCQAIYLKRYGDEQLERRIAYRKKYGIPLWGGLRDGGVDLDLEEAA